MLFRNLLALTDSNSFSILSYIQAAVWKNAVYLLVGLAPVSVCGQEVPEVIKFNQHIRPIMSNTCFACHGPDETTGEAGLRLDSFEAVVDDAGAIVPGNAEESLVYERIMDEDDPMPPEEFRHKLTDYEKAVIKKWIEQGAEYEVHWSYAQLKKPAVPRPERLAAKIANPIDAFVLRRLEIEGAAPAAMASKRNLLRRLSLDLIGMPPTRQEVADFLADESPDAYARQVDRLLASPHYGERMAARWLDIVRFSDTVGFHGDQNQRIFPFRDYVIDSINSNQPFDDFTREQLAGDLMDAPGEQQLVATGLVRLNMMTREGGAQPDEYLAKYAADRVRMVGTAWLGATLGCCECHDHKYDPFSIKDFYSMAAYFDDVRQWGVYQSYGYTPNPDLSGFSNDHPFPPEMRIKSPTLMKQIEFLEDKLDSQAAVLVSEAEAKSERFKNWLVSVLSWRNLDPSLWVPVEPSEIKLKHPEDFQRLDDCSILFTGKPVSDQSIKLTCRFEEPTRIKTIKVQALPDPGNNNQIGRANGGFQCEFNVVSTSKKLTDQDELIEVKPRYVRIELPGENKFLSLAEVQLLGEDGTNLALQGVASQSSTAFNGPANLANDGSTNGEHNKSPCVTHTEKERNPWWELDLKSATTIKKIRVFNRTDSNLGSRLKGFRLVLLDEERNIVFLKSPKTPKPSIEVSVPERASPVDFRLSEQMAYAQADRYRPSTFRNGRANVYLDKVWRSGPNRWQLPTDENQLQHNAVFHLEEPLHVEAGQTVAFVVKSSNIGRVRILVSPIARPVVDEFAGNVHLRQALSKLVATTSNELPVSKKHWNAIKSAYYRSVTPESQQPQPVRDLREAIARCYSGYAMTMVAQPLENENIRDARILPRGDWKNKSGEVVLPQTPGFLPRLKSQIDGQRQNRMDLANWIVSPLNPLTARHYVNRTWKHFFGRGLSNVLDDLGNQGEWPSHPELLDWLATEFRSDWDRKRITRLIVMSNTYRQQAGVENELNSQDPFNRLLAQQSPRRLEAEIVRDNALAIAGLLDTRWIGGRSVFPYQPAGYYSNLQFPNRSYRPQTNGLQYRRGVYMHWQRTFLHPMLANFDAPSRDECTADRIQSNSPQQALTLLNDPVFVEASVAFAIRLLQSDDRAIESMIDRAFQIALSRQAHAEELPALVQLYQSQLEYFSTHQDEAKSFCSNLKKNVGTEYNAVQLAALGQVCRVILNLHEVITRY